MLITHVLFAEESLEYRKYLFLFYAIFIFDIQRFPSISAKLMVVFHS